ncbi:MAG TPA: uroporphyrinogen-III synthase [Vicinamibacterales bacterium]|nr:uroporphyrinogen-III synthase [Vicinamibacterales bacterium]
MRPGAGFGGAKVALLESRLADETATMVRRLGGEPVSAASVVEAEVDAHTAIADFIDRAPTPGEHIVIFLTGAAVARVFATAEALGRVSRLHQRLTEAVLVARGPKPAGALARRGIVHAIAVPDPFTTADVITSLESLPVGARPVTVVHYGERNDALVAHLQGRGARVDELMVYEWRLPANVAPLSALVDALIAGQIPVLALTSQVQLRHLLIVAGDRHDALIGALNRQVLVGAVGPTCAAACRAAGIDRVVMPDHPKLAPLLHALAGAHRRQPSQPASASPIES